MLAVTLIAVSLPTSHRHGHSGKPKAAELASYVDGARTYDICAAAWDPTKPST